MPAYFIADLTVTNPDEIKKYQARAPATIEAFGGRYIVRGGAHETLEGDWTPNRMVVVEFPDVETARMWYNSPQYQEILPLRLDNSDGKVVLVEGL